MHRVSMGFRLPCGLGVGGVQFGAEGFRVYRFYMGLKVSGFVHIEAFRSMDDFDPYDPLPGCSPGRQWP